MQPAPAPPQPKLVIVMPTPLVIPAPAPQPPPSNEAGATSLFPEAPPLPLDVAGDRIGIAQKMVRDRGLQARVLWIDGTANLDSINTSVKIQALAKQAHDAGFNTIVLDVKPIVGYTLYPSKFATKLTSWKGVLLPADLDPLAIMIAAAHQNGLRLIANMSTFGEGHKLLGLGPAFTTNTDWQTVLYEATRTVRAPVIGAGALTIADVPNQLPSDQNQLALYTDTTNLHHNLTQDGVVIVTDFIGRVVAEVDTGSLGDVHVACPPEGAVLLGIGNAGSTLRNQVRMGDILTFNSIPRYVPIADAQEQKVTMFVNPNNPDVRQHELDIVQEIATNYNIDGIIFDDRMRFAAINADFSDLSKQQFEQYVGHAINWPDDVFRINPYPNQEIIEGPQYQAWLVWRALTIRNWLAQARAIVKTVRPNATVSAYVGSWYGEYNQYGSNWAANDFDGPFQFLTPAYQQTGFAGLLDWITTGCYYTRATIADGNAIGEPGASVEAAGRLTNRVVDDQTWCYAGLYVQLFDGDSDAFERCLRAAAETTQGIMLFDLSQINQFNFWPIITQAFSHPAIPPDTVPGLTGDLRAIRSQEKFTGAKEPPVVVYGGVSGTGL
jgi:uncharacterized lipoprotein YddW (UPF0748 family)